jgi:hypothetical protein
MHFSAALPVERHVMKRPDRDWSETKNQAAGFKTVEEDGP